MRNRHLTLRGHIVTHDPARFPSEFHEVALAVQETREKGGLHDMKLHEWLVMSFSPVPARAEDAKMNEVIRIPVEQFLTLSQAVAMSAYGRTSEIVFSEMNEAIVRDVPDKNENGGSSAMCTELNVSCDGTLFLDFTQGERKLKTLMFFSGPEASRILLKAMGDLTFRRNRTD